MSSRTTLAGCLIGALVFASGFAAGRTVEDGRATKSHHLFNLPSSVSEADLADALRMMNTAVADAGHPEAGYSLWKVAGEQAGEYAYLFEGNWPSQEAYDAIHESEAWQNAVEEFVEHEAIRPLEVYNRYVEIPVGTAAAGVEPAGQR